MFSLPGALVQPFYYGVFGYVIIHVKVYCGFADFLCDLIGLFLFPGDVGHRYCTFIDVVGKMLHFYVDRLLEFGFTLV